MNQDVRDSRERISRRRALQLGGTVGLGGLLAACGRGGSAASSTPSASATVVEQASPDTSTIAALLDQANTCTMSVEETQGPYWFDVDSIRSDIREDRPGTPLHLGLRVQDVSACSTGGSAGGIADSVVEIWHCDAGGSYSGFELGSAGGGPGSSSGTLSDGSYSQGDQEATTTDDGTYLRGAQVADANGIVRFTSIYPGWYQGRTVHIHLKVHIDKHTVLTSQLFMDDALSDAVFATSPYDEHTGRDTTNATDSIFDAAGLLTVKEQTDGYLGVINLGVTV